MTDITKKVTRRTAIEVRDGAKRRRLVVTLYAAGIGIRPEKTRREEFVTLERRGEGCQGPKQTKIRRVGMIENAHELCTDLECKSTDGTVCKGGGGPRWGASDDWLDPETKDQEMARLFKEKIARDKERGPRKSY